MLRLMVLVGLITMVSGTASSEAQILRRLLNNPPQHTPQSQPDGSPSPNYDPRYGAPGAYQPQQGTFPLSRLGQLRQAAAQRFQQLQGAAPNAVPPNAANGSAAGQFVSPQQRYGVYFNPRTNQMVFRPVRSPAETATPASSQQNSNLPGQQQDIARQQQDIARQQSTQRPAMDATEKQTKPSSGVAIVDSEVVLASADDPFIQSQPAPKLNGPGTAPPANVSDPFAVQPIPHQSRREPYSILNRDDDPTATHPKKNQPANVAPKQHSILLPPDSTAAKAKPVVVDPPVAQPPVAQPVADPVVGPSKANPTPVTKPNITPIKPKPAPPVPASELPTENSGGPLKLNGPQPTTPAKPTGTTSDK